MKQCFIYKTTLGGRQIRVNRQVFKKCVPRPSIDQPLLGYDAVDKKLLVNEVEANTVRLLFNKYLECRSVRKLKIEADSLGLVTKRRNSRKGITGGKPFSRGNLYQILRNPIYAGLIGHRGHVFEGQHRAILDKDIWHKVQNMLENNAPHRRTVNNVTGRHHLIGRIFDENENRSDQNPYSVGSNHDSTAQTSSVSGTPMRTKSINVYPPAFITRRLVL